MRRMLVSVIVLISISFESAAEPSGLLDDAITIQRKVEALRGTPIQSKLKMGVVNKTDLLKFLKKRIDEEYTSEEFQRSETQLKLLGLIPWQFDYRTRLEEIFVEQIGGFYDHKARELYIAEWLPGFTQKPVLAHEIFHAVQVQEWNAGHLLDSKRFKLDTLLAHQALMEGDATVLMAHYLTDAMPLGENGLGAILEQTKKGMMYQLGLSPKMAIFVGGGAKFAEAPRYVKRSLVLPYTLGAQFVWALKKDAGWSWQKINRVYQSPPTTTEQILIPETYWRKPQGRRQPPRNFKRAKSWQLVEEETLGLFMISEALDRKADHALPPRILSGWAGDELLLFQKNKEMVLVINTLWDTDVDAKAFAVAWQKSYAVHPAVEVRTRGQNVMIVLARTKAHLHGLLKEMKR